MIWFLLVLPVAVVANMQVPKPSLRMAVNSWAGGPMGHRVIIEGSFVQFRCVVTDPWLKTEWRFENHPLKYNASAGIVMSDRNQTLVLEKVSIDQSGQYSCTASYDNVKGQGESNHVYLRIQSKKSLYVHIEDKVKALSAQKTSQILCRASWAPANLQWRKGSLTLNDTENRISTEENVTTSILTFNPSYEDNGQFLFCQADNPDIPESTIEDGCKLWVGYVPQLNLKLHQPNIINEGLEVRFECNVTSANPWVSKFEWNFEGRPLHGNATAGIDLLDNNLYLRKANRDQSGQYSCIATNKEGQSESNRIRLKVQSLPSCKTNATTTIFTNINQPVNLMCEVIADPDEVDFLWGFKVNSTSEKLTKHRLVPGSTTSSVLTYTPKMDSDFRHIYCWGRNSDGQQTKPCIYSIELRDTDIFKKYCHHPLYSVCDTTNIMRFPETSDDLKEFCSNLESFNNCATNYIRICHLTKDKLPTVTIFENEMLPRVCKRRAYKVLKDNMKCIFDSLRDITKDETPVCKSISNLALETMNMSIMKQDLIELSSKPTNDVDKFKCWDMVDVVNCLFDTLKRNNCFCDIAMLLLFDFVDNIKFYKTNLCSDKNEAEEVRMVILEPIMSYYEHCDEDF